MAEPAGTGRLVQFSATDGLMLAARVFGEDSDALPILCLPGLSRNSRDFLALGAALSGDPEAPRQVIALDYRGRGASGYDPNWRNYSVAMEAQDVITAATVFGIEHAVIVGTSRGGLIAMALGALRPGLLAGVVFNDIGPVIEGMGLARIKAYLTHAGPVSGWDNAVTAVKRINASYFTGLEEDDWRAFAHAVFREDGRFLRPDHDPNLKNTVAAIDIESAIPQIWPQFASLSDIPIFVIRGETSDLLSPETVDAMELRHPDMERMTVAGQGHAPLLRDALTIGRIGAFVRRCEQARRQHRPAA